LHSILKEGGNLIVFNGWSHVIETKQTLDRMFVIRNWIIYDRVKGRGAKKNLVSTREDILWYTKGDKVEYTFNRTMSNIPKKTGGMGTKNGEANRVLSNVWSDISPIVPWSSEKVDHPTQKSVQLMERCVKIWTNEGDTVLDFTMGSGSTGVACKNLNRNFIGIELAEYYYNIACDRMGVSP
jgi:site-specific DNA-methyltransferase (adenine-specific)